MLAKGRKSSSTVRYDSFVFDSYFIARTVGISEETRATLIEAAKCNPRLLTTKESAERAGLSVVTLETWRYTGKGPPYIKLDGAPVEFRDKPTKRIAAPPDDDPDRRWVRLVIAGAKTRWKPSDIKEHIQKTYDVAWSEIASKLSITQFEDTLALLQKPKTPMNTAVAASQK
jgi:hypothetical protein